MTAPKAQRPYPPMLCSARTMAYLLDVGETWFLERVKAGALPAPTDMLGAPRWNPEEVLERFKKPDDSSAEGPAANPEIKRQLDSIKSFSERRRRGGGRAAAS